MEAESYYIYIDNILWHKSFHDVESAKQVAIYECRMQDRAHATIAIVKRVEEAVEFFEYSRDGIKPYGIKAECYSDNRAFEINFDATKWFEQASDSDIVKLASCEWGGDYPADEVAFFMRQHHVDVNFMFNYLERDSVGFECNVDESDAMRWLQENRLDLAKRLGAIKIIDNQNLEKLDK